jgi:hypothetical protein
MRAQSAIAPKSFKYQDFRVMRSLWSQNCTVTSYGFGLLVSVVPFCRRLRYRAPTGLLAERVVKLTAAPARFMLGDRRWVPSYRFQPCEKLEHAFQLLDAERPTTYSMGIEETGVFGRVVGEGRGRSRPDLAPSQFGKSHV